jgi:O-antigen biosynthesis protein WbqP
MKRIFDILISLSLLIIVFIPLILVVILIKLTSKGPAIYWSQRVGRKNKLFPMPKFRSMKSDSPQVATHLLSNSENYLTPIGSFLRKTSIDELPQIYSILKGDMSLVGPRPALFNQDDLVELRTSLGVDDLIPGVTGWAQINGRDDIPIPDKVLLDQYYLNNQSFLLDIKIIFLTAIAVIKSDNVSH